MAKEDCKKPNQKKYEKEPIEQKPRTESPSSGKTEWRGRRTQNCRRIRATQKTRINRKAALLFVAAGRRSRMGVGEWAHQNNRYNCPTSRLQDTELAFHEGGNQRFTNAR